MKRMFILIGLLCFVTACGAMPSIIPVVPITNIGDDAETITNITNSPNTFWQILLVVGWMAPDPVKIFKGIGDFILALFGRGHGAKGG